MNGERAPDRLVLAVSRGVLMNFALGFSVLHTLYVSLVPVPKPLRAGWLMRAGLAACAVFYVSISAIALRQQWPKVVTWLSGQ